MTEWIWPVTAGAIVALTALVPFVRTRWRRTVFISYRRKDSGASVARIFDHLAGRFGKHVFRDMASIRPGEPFRQAIARTLRNCDAALVVIGPDWLHCRDDQGKLRLYEPDDMVRSEVSAALESGALVIPTLVDGAAMPGEPDLPPELRGLADLQAVPIDEHQFEASLTVVANAIAASPVRRTPLLILISHLAIFVLFLVAFLADGFTGSELTTCLAIVAPLLAATGAVTIVHAFDKANAPARIRQVPVAALVIPLGFVGTIAAFVVLKTLNIGIDSFPIFMLLLTMVELLFGAYTGIVLSSLFENRRQI